jgi:hypothetical protein
LAYTLTSPALSETIISHSKRASRKRTLSRFEKQVL